MTITGNTTYTRTGKTLAKAGRKSYGGKSWGTARKIMKDTFESVADSPSTSPSEKAIADLGVRVGSHTMSDKDAASARYAVMHTISSAVGGPIGAVLANAALDAYGGKQWNSARAIMRDGLETIQTYSPNGNDQAVAKLGVTFGDRTMTDKEAAEARKAAVRTIANGSDGNRGEILAKTTLKAFGGKSWDKARALSKDGLEAIYQDEQSSSEQKALASLGIAFGGHRMTDDDGAEARQTVLKKLSSPLSSSLTDAIVDVSLDAYGGKQWGSARAIMKDGFQAILSNPNATPEEKELANLGIEVGKNRMPDDQAATARKSIMREIGNL